MLEAFFMLSHCILTANGPQCNLMKVKISGEKMHEFNIRSEKDCVRHIKEKLFPELFKGMAKNKIPGVIYLRSGCKVFKTNKYVG